MLKVKHGFSLIYVYYETQLIIFLQINSGEIYELRVYSNSLQTGPTI